MGKMERFDVIGTLGERAERLLDEYFGSHDETDIGVDVGTVEQSGEVKAVAVIQLDCGERHLFSATEMMTIAESLENNLKISADPQESADLIMLLRHAANQAEDCLKKETAALNS